MKCISIYITAIKKSNKARWLLFLLFTFYFSFVNAQAPNISRIEYFIDSDPGYGNATSLTFTGTNDVTAVLNLSLTPLASGVHIVGFRSRDVHGAWSLDNKWLFLKPYPNNGAIVQPNINRVEWYMDNDPGYGKGTPITITAGQDLSALAINITLTALSSGVHLVGVRSRDANGAWSLDNKWLFLKPYPNNGAIIQPNINRVEWYLDNDPGYGNGTPITITAGQDLSALAISISLTALSSGVHVVGIRSKDANGAWSIDNKWLFLKPYPVTNGGVQPKIVKMEYYIDNDPGYGHASAVTITSAADINSLIFNADISTVPNGAHKLGIRSMDANGAWSIDNQVDFTGGTGVAGFNWTGATSTSWAIGSNWSTGVAPAATDNITIPSGTPFAPVIPNGVTGLCKSILVKSGATVTIASGGVLKVGP
jgi:hypothetical protein